MPSGVFLFDSSYVRGICDVGILAQWWFVAVLAAIVLSKMFACCEVVPSGFVGLLSGMVCREGGHGWVHFLLSRSLHIDVVQCACVRMLVFSHCNLFFVLCSCLIVSL